MSEVSETENRAMRVSVALDELFERTAQLAENGSEATRCKKPLSIRTGFYNIDQHTGGLWPGELTIVTGGPGVGKTAFASNVAISAAKRGARVLFFSLEANAFDMVIRMCAAESRIKVRDLIKAQLSQDDWGAMVDVSNKLSLLDLLISDDASLALEDLLLISKDLTSGVDRTLVVIDGIEYVRPIDVDRIYDWTYTAGNAAIILKSLARTIDSPVLATFNYRPGRNAPIGNYEDVFNVLPDGAASAADSILHIGRRLVEGECDDFYSDMIAEVAIAKSRMCAPLKAKLLFLGEWMRFMDYADYRPEDDWTDQDQR